MSQTWDRLWSPHRMAYLKREDDGTCPFCDRTDDLIVKVGETAFVTMNLYPYNTGHLMVLPLRHVADYPDLTTGEVAEIGALTQHAMGVLRQVSGAQGFNIGMNQGAVAGAGIADHLHQHIVPRWGGDTNFFPVIAQSKSLPALLSQTRELLASAW